MLALTGFSSLNGSRCFPFHPILSRYGRGMETSAPQSHCGPQENPTGACDTSLNHPSQPDMRASRRSVESPGGA